MALSPLLPEEERVDLVEAVIEPSLTYEFDFDLNRFTGRMIDEEEAIKQFILKTIKTARFRYLIYDDDVGCELEELIEEDLPFAYVESESKRMLYESIIYDDRIEDVTKFVIAQISDELHIEFHVTLVSGNEFDMEVTI